MLHFSKTEKNYVKSKLMWGLGISSLDVYLQVNEFNKVMLHIEHYSENVEPEHVFGSLIESLKLLNSDEVTKKRAQLYKFQN